jgi:hypothetical protein
MRLGIERSMVGVMFGAAVLGCVSSVDGVSGVGGGIAGGWRGGLELFN